MVNTPEAALKLLRSASVNDRFDGARYFVKNRHVQYKKQLTERRQAERVRHIKLALDKALRLIDKIEITKPPEQIADLDPSIEDTLRKYLKAKAIQEFSNTVIHELSKRLGLLEASLCDEIENYETSISRRNFHNLKAVFDGLKNLRASTAVPSTSEFDLHELIKEVLLQEIREDVKVNLEGEQPCVIRTDVSILRLALSNGIRNSVEAIKQVPEYSKLNDITICWGKNHHEAWLSVIDKGIGVHGNAKEAFKIGNTNKEGHIGFGLGILEQCMETLGGYAVLTGMPSGGAKLTLRWGVDEK